MNWKAQDLMGIEKDFLSPYEQLQREELLAMAYLKTCHDNVISNGFSYLASFDGRHRSGKSMAAITFAYLWDSTFWPNFEKRLVQDHNEFIDAVSILAKHRIKGGCIIVDEAGVSLSSSDWYEKWMKTITQMVQMFGMWCPVILFVAPVKDFVDSRLRRMFHAYYKVSRSNRMYSNIYPYRVKFNSILGKYFYPRPTLNIDGQQIVLKRIRMTIPPDFILERYQNLEESRKTKMFDRLVDDLKKSETIKERKMTIDLDEVVRYVVTNFRAFESKNSKPTNIILDEIRIKYNRHIGASEARYVKSEAEKMLNQKFAERRENVQ